MFLYNLTLQGASGVQLAVYGNFSAPKEQEVVVSRGKVLELLRPDEGGKMQSILRRGPALSSCSRVVHIASHA